MKTLLTADRTKEDVAHEKAENLDWQRFQTMLDICYEYYVHIDTKPDLARFCKIVVDIGNDFTGDVLGNIPLKGRDRLTGEVIRKAVDSDYGREQRKGRKPVSYSRIFQSLTRELINMAEADGKGPKNKSADVNSFKYVSDLLYKYGITNKGKRYSASTIADW